MHVMWTQTLRRKSGMTQARLGDIIGICRQSVNEIENRHVYPHYTTIRRFADLEQRHEEGRRVCGISPQPFLALNFGQRRPQKRHFPGFSGRR
jgi:DNA-binding XRE family transcriptional regulator